MHSMVDPLVTPLFGVAVAFTKILLRSTNNNLGADIIGDTAEPLAAISQLVLGKKSSKKQLERAINRDLDTRMRNMNERCRREGIDPNRLANPCAEVEAVLNTIDDHEWILEQAVHDPDALRTYFQKHALKQRAQVDARLVPYFDELIEAVAEQYINYAERSPNYLRVAAKHSFKDNRETREKLDRLHDTVADVPHKVAELISSESKPSRVFFGSRPDVVAEYRFVERSEQEHLNALITDPTQRRTVLVGMRGCGKTQLAASLAKQCEDANWNLVAWINAVSRESIQSDLVELAKKLEINTSDQPTQDQVIRSFLSRMKSAKPADRLIIFDNVEDINHLRGLIPSGDGVRVVVTTTNDKGWNYQGWDAIRIGVFDHEKSINYLLTVTKSDDHDTAGVLAKRLGDLPLAIAQAAETARNKDLSLARYLKRLESRGEELVIRPISGDEYTDDVAMVLWMAAEDAVDSMKNGTKEMARRQLGALALLAESGVPTRWLDPTIEQQDDWELQGTNPAEDEDAHDALTELIHRSIVQQSTDGSTIMLHRLQAQVLRESWTEDERIQAYEWAVYSISNIVQTKPQPSDVHARFELSINLISQLHAISKQKHSHPLLANSTVHYCLLYALKNAYNLGLSHIGVKLVDAAAIALESMLDDSRTTIALLQHLAMVFLEEGSFINALPLLETALSYSDAHFGPNDRLTLTCRHNLAFANFSTRRFDRAIELYEALLRDRKQLLGHNHEDTIATRLTLAYSYQHIGRIQEAITEYESILADIESTSNNSAHTLTVQHNLAGAYEQSGRFTEAINLFEELITESDRLLGSTDPKTIASRSNLAGVYLSKQDFDKAISLFEQVLTTSQTFKKADSFQSLAISSNLGYAYRRAGRYDDAIKILEDTLSKSTDTLGDNSLLTVEVRTHLQAARRDLAQQKAESSTEESAAQD